MEESQNDSAEGVSASGEQPSPAGATFRSEAGTTFDLARFLVIFSAPHFFLDAATFHEFSEAADGFLDRLFVTNDQSDHYSSLCHSANVQAWTTEPLEAQ
jgi:hypothetical protein